MKNLYQLIQTDCKKIFNKITKDLFQKNQIKNTICKRLSKMSKKNPRSIKLIYLNFIIPKNFLITN